MQDVQALGRVNADGACPSIGNCPGRLSIRYTETLLALRHFGGLSRHSKTDDVGLYTSIESATKLAECRCLVIGSDHASQLGQQSSREANRTCAQHVDEQAQKRFRGDFGTSSVHPNAQTKKIRGAQARPATTRGKREEQLAHRWTASIAGIRLFRNFYDFDGPLLHAALACRLAFLIAGCSLAR
jgi:hypothetical protein